MWDSGSEFVAGNTFGATSEYWRNSSITHSWPFRVGGFMVHLTVVNSRHMPYVPWGDWSRASCFEALPIHSRRRNNFRSIRPAPSSSFIRNGLANNRIFFFACNVLLLWCILALIRHPLHPRLGVADTYKPEPGMEEDAIRVFLRVLAWTTVTFLILCVSSFICARPRLNSASKCD